MSTPGSTDLQSKTRWQDLGSSLLGSSVGKEGLFSSAQSKETSPRPKLTLLLSLGRQLELRTGFKNDLIYIPKAQKELESKGELKSDSSPPEKSKKQAQKGSLLIMCGKTPISLGTQNLNQECQQHQSGGTLYHRKENSQIGWSCCSGPSWHSQRPPAAGWTAGWCPWRAVTAETPKLGRREHLPGSEDQTCPRTWFLNAVRVRGLKSKSLGFLEDLLFPLNSPGPVGVVMSSSSPGLMQDSL